MRVAVMVALLAASTSGCGVRPATQIVVEVDAESGVRADLDVVHVVVNGGDGSTVGAPGIQRLDVRETPPRWPFTVVIAPLDRDVERRYEVVVTAEARTPAGGGARPMVARVRAISGFVPGETRVLRLLLEDACRGVTCPDDATCRLGACRPAAVDPTSLPSASPGADAGTRRDGQVSPVFVPRNVGSDVLERATGDVIVDEAALLDTDSLAAGGSMAFRVALLGAYDTSVEGTGTCADILVLGVDRFEVRAGITLEVRGSRALAIVARDEIVIDGFIDAGARGATPGPGAVWVPGRGASYGSHSSGNACEPTYMVGPLYGDELLTGLCGGSGGDETTSRDGGGGGAVQLSAGRRVVVSGGIRATGGGGVFRGGSGGGILIQAPAVSITGALSVNGGGGGAGDYCGSPCSPRPGEDGVLEARAARGAAGFTRPMNGNYAGGGGDGAYHGGPATMPELDVWMTGMCTGCCGGGPGGGAGRIRIDGDAREYGPTASVLYPGLPGIFTEGPLTR